MNPGQCNEGSHSDELLSFAAGGSCLIIFSATQTRPSQPINVKTPRLCMASNEMQAPPSKGGARLGIERLDCYKGIL